jgi:hypothetical protein
MTSSGEITAPENWSAGMFDSSAHPKTNTRTSTGNKYDLIAGNRNIRLSSGYATFTTLALGAKDSNKSGVSLGISGGTLNVSGDLIINQNTTHTASACTITQSGGQVEIGSALQIGSFPRGNPIGEASYTISGGSLSAKSINLAIGSEGNEHSFVIEGQAAKSITSQTDFFAGGGDHTGFNNIVFKLGANGITPLEIKGKLFSDSSTEYIVDGSIYKGGPQAIVLATYKGVSSTSATQTIQNFSNGLNATLKFGTNELTLVILP